MGTNQMKGELSRYIYKYYTNIWRTMSLITFLTIIGNVLFIKAPLITIVICIIHLLIVVPSAIIAKREDNKLRDEIKEIVLRDGEKY